MGVGPRCNTKGHDPAPSRKGFFMSFQFCPIYSGDYLRDTRHLSPLRHGVYFLFLLYCWDQKGPLPLDEQECAGIGNCRSSDEIEAMRYILDRYFTRMDDGHYNKRMQVEIERAEAISRARSDAGRIGYQAKAKQLLSKSKAKAKQVPLPLPPHHTPTPTKEYEASASLSGKPDVLPRENANVKAKDDEAREVISFLNKCMKRNYQPVKANLTLARARLAEASLSTIKAVIATKCDQWEKKAHMAEYLRPKTLLNATNFAQYLGELPPELIK